MNIYLQTHGCQMNEYDSEKIGDIMRAQFGSTITKSPEDADMLVLNTCSIREKAEEKVYSEVGRWRRLKEKNLNSLLQLVDV